MSKRKGTRRAEQEIAGYYNQKDYSSAPIQTKITKEVAEVPPAKRVITKGFAPIPSMFWPGVAGCFDVDEETLRMAGAVGQEQIRDAGINPQAMMGCLTSASLTLAITQAFKKGGERIVAVEREMLEKFENTDALSRVTGSDLRKPYPCFGLWTPRDIKGTGTHFILVKFAEETVLGEGGDSVVDIPFVVGGKKRAIGFGGLLEPEELRGKAIGNLAISAYYEGSDGEVDASIVPLYANVPIVDSFTKIVHSVDQAHGERARAIYEENAKAETPTDMAQQAFLQGLNFVVNCLMTMAFYPDYVQERQVVEKFPKTKKIRRGRARIKKSTIVCLRQTVTDRPADRPAVAAGSGAGSKTTHWRRGHWRRQPHGVNWDRANAASDKPQETIDLGDGRLGHMAWLEPTLIKGENE